MSELLRISGLSGGYMEGVDILRGIDLSIDDGEAVGIIGLNGSGKSTFGKAIMNMIPIRKGEIFFNEVDIMALTTHEIARKGISIMQQGGQVFQNLSVWENLQIAFGSKADNSVEQLSEVIPMLRISKKVLQHKMADKLSGGQRHQLALAMTLATNPKMVILDEPSAGLSPKAVEEMYSILRVVREKFNVTVLLIEQNISKAVEYCGRYVLMQTGGIVDSGNQDLDRIEDILFKNIL